MEPLVVIIQGRQFKLKNLNNLVASIFGENYFDLSQDERLKIRYEKSHAISKFHKKSTNSAYRKGDIRRRF